MFAVGKTFLIDVAETPSKLCKNLLTKDAKCEFYNPSGSVKDRLAKIVLEKVKPGQTLVVPLCGNLAVSLAVFSFGRNKIIAVLPESHNSSNVDLLLYLKSLGVVLFRTPFSAHPESEESCFSVAKKLVAESDNAVLVDEFELNEAVDAYQPIADEILTELKQVDGVVVGIQSGATLTALSEVFRKANPKVRIVGVKPEATHSYIQGVGTTFDFVVSGRYQNAVDDVVHVSDTEAFQVARKYARTKGMLMGSASGAVLAAALSVTKDKPNQNWVCILPESARYEVTTLLNDDWMLGNDLTTPSAFYDDKHADPYRGASIEDLQLPPAMCISEAASLEEAQCLMHANDFSQLPVHTAASSASNPRLCGFITDSHIHHVLTFKKAKSVDSVQAVMYTWNKKEKNFEIITPETPLIQVEKFLQLHSVGFVTDAGKRWCLGVVTMMDLVRFLKRRLN